MPTGITLNSTTMLMNYPLLSLNELRIRFPFSIAADPVRVKDDRFTALALKNIRRCDSLNGTAHRRGSLCPRAFMHLHTKG
jgi:hypothetical protein